MPSRRGQWTGGRPPLGHDVVEKKLVVNEVEAELVRTMFQLYLDRGSPIDVARALNDRGEKTKTVVCKTGRVLEGHAWSKSSVLAILKSATCLGKVGYGGELSDGEGGT